MSRSSRILAYAAGIVLIGLWSGGCSSGSQDIEPQGDRSATTNSGGPNGLGERELEAAVTAQFDAAKDNDAEAFRASFPDRCLRSTSLEDVAGFLAEAQASGLDEWTLDIRDISIEGADTAAVTFALTDAAGDPVRIDGSVVDTDRWIVERGAWRTEDC